jgi:FtsP/CotA-like multicopper oxidase with cupredoxin domain
MQHRATVAAASLLIVGLAGACASALGDTDGSGGVVRTYYIAAEEVEWDYAPTGGDKISGRPLEGLGAMVMSTGPMSLGRVYRKAIFREYTDSTFAEVKPRPKEWEHLGILGPLLRAVVGDTFRIVFRNKGTYPHTLHPHGVIYNKDSEGAPYVDGTSGADQADDGVPPGGTHTYVWPVPERAGPTDHDGSSVFWMYHSHANENRDVNAGLLGPMLVTARGKAKPDGSPIDVDRELIVMFGEFDENASWYYEHNIKAHAPDPAKWNRMATFADFSYLAGLRETINGFSFGHTPEMVVKMGERVRWYVFATSNFEVHAPHWHGQTVVANGMRTDMLSLLTMQMVTANMVPDNRGTWLFHCHVAPHLEAGMQAMFRVE